MPSKTKKTAAADKAVQQQFSAQLLDQLVPGPMTPWQVQGIFEQFKKALFEQALGAEMSHHQCYATGQVKPEGSANHRNGTSANTVLIDAGALRLKIPRDRQDTFEPQLIGKHERRRHLGDECTVLIKTILHAHESYAQNIAGLEAQHGHRNPLPAAAQRLLLTHPHSSQDGA